MKPERVRQIVEAIGLSAVVISLVLVAYQIRQANRIAQGTATYEIVRDINKFNNMVLSDPMFADLVSEVENKDFVPSQAQAERVQALAQEILNNWAVQEVAFRNGLLTKEQFSLSRDSVRSAITRYPALLPFWKAILNDYPHFADYEILQPVVHRTAE